MGTRPSFKIFSLRNKKFPPSAGPRPGFTLIELVMVIVIIGILSAVSIPRFRAINEVRLDAAARSALAHVRYVRNAAVTQSIDTRIVFDTGAETYRAFYSGNGGVSWTPLIDPATRSALSVDLTEESEVKGVDISSADFDGGSVLRFNWKGIPQTGSGTDLETDGEVVFSYGARSLSIDVIRATGRIVLR